MDKESILNYLRSYFDIEDVDETINLSLLPNYIKLQYQINIIKLNTKLFLVFSSDKSDFKIAQLQNIKKIMRNTYNLNVIYNYNRLIKYQRQILVKNKLAFIVINKHLYIPELAVSFIELDYKEKEVTNTLSFTAQYVLFYLLTVDKQFYSSVYLQGKLNVNRMYLSRSSLELENRKIIKVNNSLRVKEIILADSKMNIWNQHIKSFKNPIKKILYVKKNNILPFQGMFIKSGTLALSKISMLQEDEETYAIESKKWELIKDRFQEVYKGGINVVKIEIWKSRIPIYNSSINILALYFSIIKELEKDERVYSSYSNVLYKILGGEVKW